MVDFVCAPRLGGAARAEAAAPTPAPKTRPAIVRVGGGERPELELASCRPSLVDATAPSGGASITGGGGIGGRAGGGGSAYPATTGDEAGVAGTYGAGASPTGAGCAPMMLVVAVFTVEATDRAMLDCVTSPSSPGLAIRIETAMLQSMQTEGSEGAPFHVQFQIQVCGPFPDDASGVVFEMFDELSLAVLPVVSPV
jgi:hypothetical protein